MTAKSPASALLRDCIQKIATGPEYSKDLDRDTARRATLAILDGEVDDVQAAIYFIALRMKRETADENAGVLEALIERSQLTQVAVDTLADISDPYDGHARGLPVVAFVPALLAACGLPAVNHGLERVGPKFGTTQRQVLRAAGIDVDLSPEAAARQIERPEVGWAYLDQRHFCPALHALVGLRETMVKRPVLTTVESLIGPLRARGRTLLHTGYVHRAYPEKYAALAAVAGFDGALIVRGVEGGVIPSLQQAASLYRWAPGASLTSEELAPQALGIEADSRAVPLPSALLERNLDGEAHRQQLAEASAEAGLAALDGQPGPARSALIYAAALSLHHAGLAADLAAAARLAAKALDSGAARCHFDAAAHGGPLA